MYTLNEYSSMCTLLYVLKKEREKSLYTHISQSQ